MPILVKGMRCSLTHTHEASRQSEVLPDVAPTTTCERPWTRSGAASCAPSTHALQRCARTISLIPISAMSQRLGEGCGREELTGRAASHLAGGKGSTLDWVNALEAEKAQSKAGRLALSFARLDMLILDGSGYLPFGQAGGRFCFTCPASSMNARAC